MTKKLILITGVSSGIGRAIYEQYQRFPQYIVVGASRHGPDITVDLSSKSVNYDNFPQSDILINCAGIMPLSDDLEKVFQVNFFSITELVKAQLTTVKCVINIASISGVIGEAEFPNYAASKAALLTFTLSMAKKYAPEGIRFNCISPGFVKTNLFEGDTPEELINEIPLKREASPIEIFEVVRLIELSTYMTGSNLIIDGGLTCRF